jgi:hypothetical protein
MRALILIATVALALAGCGKGDQTGKTQNVDDNMTAENIVSNDVTAIDAVTGDAANMAADVDYSNLADNSLDNMLNEGNAAKPAAKTPRAKPQATQPVANTANSTTNAE